MVKARIGSVKRNQDDEPIKYSSANAGKCLG